MKKTILFSVLTVLVVGVVYLNINTQLKTKNEANASGVEYSIDKNSMTNTKSTTVKGGDALSFDVGGLSGCMDITACTYEKGSTDQKNAKCTYAWYVDASGNPAFPAKTDTKMLMNEVAPKGNSELFIKTREVQYDESGVVLSVAESKPKSRGRTTTADMARIIGTNACEAREDVLKKGFIPAVDKIEASKNRLKR